MRRRKHAPIPRTNCRLPRRLEVFKPDAHCREITAAERAVLQALPEAVRKKLSKHFGLNGYVSANFRFDAQELKYRTNLKAETLALLMEKR